MLKTSFFSHKTKLQPVSGKIAFFAIQYHLEPALKNTNGTHPNWFADSLLLQFL